MSKASDKITVDEIKSCNISDKLIAIILDQQFEYWYDPCGKSGYDTDTRLTSHSQYALRRLKDLLWHGEIIKPKD